MVKPRLLYVLLEGSHNCHGPFVWTVYCVGLIGCWNNVRFIFTYPVNLFDTFQVYFRLKWAVGMSTYALPKVAKGYSIVVGKGRGRWSQVALLRPDAREGAAERSKLQNDNNVSEIYKWPISDSAQSVRMCTLFWLLHDFSITEL